MKPVHFDCWPGGHLRCLTLSYDDGVRDDCRLVEIMDQHGIRGSFHLNSLNKNRESHVQPDEYRALYANHEVSVHMCTHPFPTCLTREGILMETLDNRREMETAVGYPVRGMSYPCGDYDNRVVDLLTACGMEYGRTTKSHGGFHLPENWLTWHPTCHHKNALEHIDAFLAEISPWHRGLRLFYVWGHSYEFDRQKNWDLIESFCAKVGKRDDIWYATNIEIVDYVHALHAVRSSVDGKTFYNPSALSVWFRVRDDATPKELKAGETLTLA